MILKPICVDIQSFPAKLRPLLSGANLYDSSCSEQAKVIFIEKDGGYFLKISQKGSLEREVKMTQYFHRKGLSANVLSYISEEKDWMLSEKIPGDDCTLGQYLEEPKRLCDIIAERLAILHSTDFDDCSIPNHTECFIASAERNRSNGMFDKSKAENWGYKNPEDAWSVVETNSHLLKANVLLHGDYCLPNIILNDWNFSGFIDLDSAGVGDRHVDLYWGSWTLFYNLKTDKYRERFFDAYGRDKIEKDILRIVAAFEVFG